jgi:PAS domain S-box-containing protein
MKKFSNTKLVLFFAVLTVVLTWVVIFTYGTFLRRPFYAWVEARWPGRSGLQDQIQQSVEHFFISTVVDVIVVTLLLRLVNRQQRRLRDSEERYRALFEHASDGIGVVRAADHVIIDVNKKFAEVLGHEPQSLIGAHVCELFEKGGDEPGGGSFLEHSVCYMSSDDGSEADRLLDGNEITIRTQAGAPRVISLSRSTISTGNERLFILIIRDLTERKRLEREKQEMERQLFQTSKLASIGELSAGVAHEINNPLNGMINFAQLLKDDGVARNDSERQMLDGIIDEGERIARIVRNLLTFARQDPHLPTEVAVAQVIKNSVTLFEHQLDKDRIELEMDVAQDTLPVRADASRLRQVFVNVISNAHHALKAKHSDVKLLRIMARNVERGAGRMVRIEFFDNGVGIAREHLDKVFDPFFTTRRDTGGTGLGLSLSFGIIHDYGGNITAESEEGSFTRFIIELPADASRESEYEKSVAGGRRA